MAQEYKKWDQKYKTAAFMRESAETQEEIEEAKKPEYDSWIYSDLERSWKMDYIRNGVYSLDGSCDQTAEEWQKFRVGLKAVSTRVKLVRLRRYWDETGKKDEFKDYAGETICSFEYSDEERERRYMRIDNYIGALVRGGQLGLKHQVRR